jgi:hypothetical protein
MESLLPESIAENSTLDNFDHGQYSSFLLRCQKTPSGEIRVRLMDVQTGQVVAAILLDKVPDLIRSFYAHAEHSVNIE